MPYTEAILAGKLDVADVIQPIYDEMNAKYGIDEKPDADQLAVMRHQAFAEEARYASSRSVEELIDHHEIGGQAQREDDQVLQLALAHHGLRVYPRPLLGDDVDDRHPGGEGELPQLVHLRDGVLDELHLGSGLASHRRYLFAAGGCQQIAGHISSMSTSTRSLFMGHLAAQRATLWRPWCR